MHLILEGNPDRCPIGDPLATFQSLGVDLGVGDGRQSIDAAAPHKDARCFTSSEPP
jgi:hypothetical protein